MHINLYNVGCLIMALYPSAKYMERKFLCTIKLKVKYINDCYTFRWQDTAVQIAHCICL